MTLEEKLTYMQTVSMEQARAEGNAIIDAHREALEKIFSDHKSEMMRQAETRIKAETTNAKRTVSQALAKSQLEIKRSQGKVQQELKDKVFEEAMESGEVLKGTVTAALKGGLSVSYGEGRVFIPASLVSDVYEKDLSKYADVRSWKKKPGRSLR